MRPSILCPYALRMISLPTIMHGTFVIQLLAINDGRTIRQPDRASQLTCPSEGDSDGLPLRRYRPPRPSPRIIPAIDLEPAWPGIPLP